MSKRFAQPNWKKFFLIVGIEGSERNSDNTIQFSNKNDKSRRHTIFSHFMG